VKTKSSSVFLAILLLCGCAKKEAPREAAPRICNLPLKDVDGVRLLQESPPVMEATGFPASFVLDNLDSPEARTCTFELVGSEVRPERLFFRYGRKEIEVTRLAETRMRITYPISDRSYGLVSLEPAEIAPADPFQWAQDGLSFQVSGGILLRFDAGIPRVRSLGPSTEVHAQNTGDTARSLEILVDNTSDRLSEASMRGVGPGQVRLKREGPLALRLNGILQPGEEVWLMLRPRPLHYPFSFVFGGDVKEQLGTFVQLVERVRTRADPLFMVAVGDYTRNSLPGELDEFFRRTANLPFPVYYVKGNHESRCQGDVHFRRLFGPQSFSFSVDRMLFVILDTSASRPGGYLVGDRQLAWADTTLGENKKIPWKFLVLHAPPHPLHGETLHPDYPSNLAPEDAGKIKALARKHRVSYVLSGHAHLYARGEEDGVVYLTSGGGGATLYTHTPLPGFSISTEKHLMLFHVNAGSIEEERITLR
jgi:hypothetical protein